MAARIKLLLMAALVASTATADSIVWRKLGGWDVSFYPGSAGCQAFALFEKNTAFFIGFDDMGELLTLDVTIVDQSWNSIEDGKEYPIRLRFGDEGIWSLDMDGVRVDGFPGLNIMIDAKTPEAKLFIEEFKRELSMEWSYEDAPLGRYTLSGSRDAFDEVKRCQIALKDGMPEPPVFLPTSDQTIEE